MIKLIFILIFSSLYAQNLNWQKIHDEREYSISGVSKFKDGFIVVHDNKKRDQARISYIDEELKIINLIWPEKKLPIDLEAVIQIPGIINRYILMESDGKCFEVAIDPIDFRIELIHTF